MSLRLFLCVAGNQNYSQSQSTGRFPEHPGSCPGEQGSFPAVWWRLSRSASVWVEEPGTLAAVSLELIVAGPWLAGTKVKNKDLERLCEGITVPGSLRPT